MVRMVHVLVCCHALISLIGIFVHMEIHPPWRSLTFWWAAPMSTVSFFLIPALLLRKGTVGLGVLMNGFAVCAGVVGMIFFGFQNPPESGHFWDALAMTGAPVSVLLVKLPLAQAIFKEMTRQEVP